MTILSDKCFKLIKANNDIYAICKIICKSKNDPKYYFDDKEFTLQMGDRQIKYKYVEPSELLISIPHNAVLVTEVTENDKSEVLGIDIEILKDVMTILGLLCGYGESIRKLRSLNTLYTDFSIFAPNKESPIIIVSEWDRRYFSLIAPKIIETFKVIK